MSARKHHIGDRTSVSSQGAMSSNCIRGGSWIAGNAAVLERLSDAVTPPNGNVVASSLFEKSEKCDQAAPTVAVAAFSDAFDPIAKSTIAWAVEEL